MITSPSAGLVDREETDLGRTSSAEGAENRRQVPRSPSAKTQAAPAAVTLCQFLDADAEQAAALLRAAGNPRRLLVLCLLIEHGEMSVGSLLEHLDLSQSALSQHLARMREEGLVTFRRASQTLYYRIDDERVERLIAALKDIYCLTRQAA